MSLLRQASDEVTRRAVHAGARRVEAALEKLPSPERTRARELFTSPPRERSGAIGLGVGVAVGVGIGILVTPEARRRVGGAVFRGLERARRIANRATARLGKGRP